MEEPAYQERPFIGTGLRMQVALEPAWLESGWQMFLGVRAGVTSEECVKMLTRPERLGMKIGSSDRVDTIFTRGQEGLKFTPAPRPPRDLPSPAAGPPSQTYFEVSRESGTNEWAHVVKAKTLAIRVAGAGRGGLDRRPADTDDPHRRADEHVHLHAVSGADDEVEVTRSA